MGRDISEVQAIVIAELDRNTAAVGALIEAYPDLRSSIACAFLGAAVATADTMGVDVEGFIASLRKRYEKPDVLVPPTDKRIVMIDGRIGGVHIDVLGDDDG
jgi:hypothetical protein